MLRDNMLIAWFCRENIVETQKSHKGKLHNLNGHSSVFEGRDTQIQMSYTCIYTLYTWMWISMEVPACMDVAESTLKVLLSD